ncbi:hypothetical protein KNP414_03119 [Paenibacillus mucilaginosus KNP414]|uniref:Uncharacterized protein n=1 Tax=Paenibacillus mucilaginosus (strain KNP414) TaxID=1036673 RepID=F8FB34_PAEMK|nr:hypothetical protein KNP414_03119 [Paenibacillus mucilaginosus KNP414]
MDTEGVRIVYIECRSETCLPLNSERPNGWDYSKSVID